MAGEAIGGTAKRRKDQAWLSPRFQGWMRTTMMTMTATSFHCWFLKSRGIPKSPSVSKCFNMFQCDILDDLGYPPHIRKPPIHGILWSSSYSLTTIWNLQGIWLNSFTFLPLDVSRNGWWRIHKSGSRLYQPLRAAGCMGSWSRTSSIQIPSAILLLWSSWIHRGSSWRSESTSMQRWPWPTFAEPLMLPQESPSLP